MKNIYIDHNYNRNQIIDFRVENVGTGYDPMPAFGDRGPGAIVFDVDLEDAFFNTGLAWEIINDGKLLYDGGDTPSGYIMEKFAEGDYIVFNRNPSPFFGDQLRISVNPVTLNPNLYFLELHDVDPASYSGQAGKSVIVNIAEDGVEFGDPPSGVISYLDLDDTDNAYATFAGMVPEVNAAEDALEFGHVPGINTDDDTILPNRMLLAVVTVMPPMPDPNTVYFIAL